MYRPEQIFGADQNGWPGDWEGRTILALALEEAVTHRRLPFLRITALLWKKSGMKRAI